MVTQISIVPDALLNVLKAKNGITCEEARKRFQKMAEVASGRTRTRRRNRERHSNIPQHLFEDSSSSSSEESSISLQETSRKTTGHVSASGLLALPAPDSGDHPPGLQDDKDQDEEGDDKEEDDENDAESPRRAATPSDLPSRRDITDMSFSSLDEDEDESSNGEDDDEELLESVLDKTDNKTKTMEVTKSVSSSQPEENDNESMAEDDKESEREKESDDEGVLSSIEEEEEEDIEHVPSVPSPKKKTPAKRLSPPKKATPVRRSPRISETPTKEPSPAKKTPAKKQSPSKTMTPIPPSDEPFNTSITTFIESAKGRETPSPVRKVPRGRRGVKRKYVDPAIRPSHLPPEGVERTIVEETDTTNHRRYPSRHRIPTQEYWKGDRVIYRRDSTGLAWRVDHLEKGIEYEVKRRKVIRHNGPREAPAKKIDPFNLSLHASHAIDLLKNNDKRKEKASKMAKINFLLDLEYKESSVSKGLFLATMSRNKNGTEGVIKMTSLASKEMQCTSKYTTKFVVMTGAVSFKIGQKGKPFIAKTLYTITLPPKTYYSMENLRNDDAYVLFTVTRVSD